MTLFINQDEYIGLFTQEAGVRVAIHKPHAVPFPEDHGFDARPGTLTSFGIRVNEMIRTPLPYGGEDCTEVCALAGAKKKKVFFVLFQIFHKCLKTLKCENT